MLVTGDAIVCHLVGDYVLQSDWMAKKKMTESFPALVHSVIYALPFLLLKQTWGAFLFIAGTHFIIDRWRLARYVCWFKNFIAPTYRRSVTKWVMGGRAKEMLCVPWNPSFKHCQHTGYNPDTTPDWLSVWLMIITDNTIHLILNGIAIKYL